MKSSTALISISALFALASADELDSNKFDTKNATTIIHTAQDLANSIVNDFYKRQPVGSPAGLFWSRLEAAGGDEIFFDESAAIWDALIANVNLTGNTNLTDVITEGLYYQLGSFEAFMPINQTKDLTNQAQSQWGLTALSAAEFGIPNPKDKPDFRTIAQNVFDIMVARWIDKGCEGGFREGIFPFSNLYDTSSNFALANFFQLSARLFKLTGNGTHSEWAGKALREAQDQGFVAEDGMVYDWARISDSNCSLDKTFSTSRVLGSWIVGSAAMYNATTTGQWRDRLEKFVNKTSAFTSGGNSPNIEQPCAKGSSQTNGTFADCGIGNTLRYARSLSRAVALAPFTSEKLTPMLEFSAQQARTSCGVLQSQMKDEDWDLSYACKTSWDGSDADSMSDISILGSAASMEVIQGLLFNPAMKQQAEEITANKTQSGEDPQETGAAGRTAGSMGLAALAAVLVAAFVA